MPAPSAITSPSARLLAPTAARTNAGSAAIASEIARGVRGERAITVPSARSRTRPLTWLRAASAPSAAARTSAEPNRWALRACEALADDVNSDSISEALSLARSAKRLSIACRAFVCELCSDVPRPTSAARISSAAPQTAGPPRRRTRWASEPSRVSGTPVYRHPCDAP